MKTYTDAQIDGMISLIERGNKKLQDSVHEVAVSILKIWHDNTARKGCNDIFDHASTAADRLTRLGNAVPYHRNAFFRWVGLTGLHWSDSKAAFFAHKAEENRMMGKLFRELRDKPFWEISPAPKASPFDMYADLAKLIEKARKRASKPQDGDVIDNALIAKLAEVLRDSKPAEEPEH